MRWLVPAAIVLGCLVTLVAGPVIGFASLIALTVALATVHAPVVGLGLCIFTSTCLQNLGSAHIVGLPASLGKLVGALTTVAWLVHVTYSGWRLIVSPQLVALGALAAVILLSAMLIDPSAPLEGPFKFLQVYLLLLLVTNIAGQSERALVVSVLALTAALSVSGIIAIIEHFLPGLALESDDQRLKEGTIGAVLDRESVAGIVIKRVTGGIGDANWLAYTLAATLPLSIYWWQRHRGFWARLMIAASVALQGAGLIYSFTRTGFLGLAIAGLYLMLRRLVPLRPVLFLALAVGVMSLFYLPAGFAERLFSAQYLKEGSTPIRRFLVQTAYSSFLKSPIVGHGYGEFGSQLFGKKENWSGDSTGIVVDWRLEFQRSVEAGQQKVEDVGTHNLYLEVLVEYGLLGFVPFMAWFHLLRRDLLYAEVHGRADQRLLAACIWAGTLAFLTCGLFGHCMTLKVVWILAGLAMALRRVVEAQVVTRPRIQ